MHSKFVMDSRNTYNDFIVGPGIAGPGNDSSAGPGSRPGNAGDGNAGPGVAHWTIHIPHRAPKCSSLRGIFIGTMTIGAYVAGPGAAFVCPLLHQVFRSRPALFGNQLEGVVIAHFCRSLGARECAVTLVYGVVTSARFWERCHVGGVTLG